MQIHTEHLTTVLENYGKDLQGKVVAITGTTSGTGYVCARELGRFGATVLLLNRESERSANSLNQLQKEAPAGKFDQINCDLQSFDSVRNASEQIKKKFEIIDVLINNAGVMALKDVATIDGYDVQIQTNVISHFLLTNELFLLLRKSEEARIINHSSMARLGGPLDSKYFEKNGGNLGGDGSEEENMGFQGPRWERYHQTKLANCNFTYGLEAKLKEAGISNVISLLAHPGLALTNLQVTTAEDGGMESNSGLMERAQTAEDGATGIIRAALDKDAVAGDFYGPTAGWKGYPDLIEPENILLDETNININWQGCENAVGKFEF